MKYNLSLFLVLFCIGCQCFSQAQPEREHRIKKSEFPSYDLNPMLLLQAKKLRYYKEVDTSATTYSLKFKKNKMDYHMDFNEKGVLLNMGFLVKEIDIPSHSYSTITTYLNNNFKRVKIKRMYQRYAATEEDAIRNTFQNLILPSITYEIQFRAKKEQHMEDFLATFNAEGKVLDVKRALPANFDRILY